MLQAAFAEMVNGACLSFGMLPVMCRAAAKLLLEHARRRSRPLRAAARERGVGRDDLHLGAAGRLGRRTDPDARVPADDGSYRLSGNKIFITYGDQDLTPQICHMVLARTPGAPAPRVASACSSCRNA